MQAYGLPSIPKVPYPRASALRSTDKISNYPATIYAKNRYQDEKGLTARDNELNDIINDSQQTRTLYPWVPPVNPGEEGYLDPNGSHKGCDPAIRCGLAFLNNTTTATNSELFTQQQESIECAKQTEAPSTY